MNRILLIAGLWAPWVAGCTVGHATEGPLAPEPAAIHVPTAIVAARPMPHELPLTGQLVAHLQSDVAANSAGRVLRTYVERGSFVTAGAVLAQLDTSAAAISVAQAKANLQVALTSQDLAGTLCKRNQELFDKGAISREEWERTDSQCKTSAASAEAARAQVAMVTKNIADGVVRAPFAGVIGERYVSVGEYVQPFSRVANLVELNPLRLQLTVPEAELGHIRKAQAVTFTVEAYPARTFTGTIQYLDPTVRSTSRDALVEAVVKNADFALKPGMFAVARLHLPDEEQPVVPNRALVGVGTTTHLFAVVDGHLEERIVQRGPERDGQVVVLDGVRAGEKIVSEISEAMKDGVPVN